uniref:Uncharacterized protein n=1 Tax=Musca domestica TaxID=7370 RepID=A0A1I8M1M1_MUSDO
MAGQLSLVLKFHIRIFQAFGFCTVSFGNRTIVEERLLFLFYTVVAAEIYVMYICFSITVVDFQAVLFWCIYTPFIYVIHLRNLQFIFFVELIRLKLVAVQTNLRKLMDFTNCGISKMDCEENLHSKIANTQQSYQLTFEMFLHFHNSFGFSMVAVILVIYVRIVVNTYFSYYSDNKGWEYYGFILLIPSLLQCPMFLIASKCCMNTIQDITQNLHCIDSQFGNDKNEISIQLQNFSLQILHQNISINGIGITRMDGYMLTRLIGSITTYMIFFIQFMPKFTNI